MVISVSTARRIVSILFAVFLLALLRAVLIGIADLVHIFGAHAGVAFTQAEIAAAHNEVTADPRHQVVPKIIHQIFHNWTDPKNEMIPIDWDILRQTCIAKNQDYEYRVSASPSCFPDIHTYIYTGTLKAHQNHRLN